MEATVGAGFRLPSPVAEWAATLGEARGDMNSGSHWFKRAVRRGPGARLANGTIDPARDPGRREDERQNEEHGHAAGDGDTQAEVMRPSSELCRDPRSGHCAYDGTQARSLRYRSAGITSRAKARMPGTKSSGRLPK